jgi:hypothetical protein
LEGTRLVRVGNTKIIVVYHDYIEESRVEAVLGPILSVYKREGPELVELHLYRDVSRLTLELSESESRAGVSVSAVFPITYEVWSGIPRIHVAIQEALEEHDRETSRALLVHEAVHSVLHNSLEYYLSEHSVDPVVFYVAATSIKDLEVHGYMALKKFNAELNVLKKYWTNSLGEEWQQPFTLEELFNILKAMSVWVALGEKPPLSKDSFSVLRRVLEYQAELLRQWRSLGVRPWHSRVTYAKIIGEIINTQYHGLLSLG